MKHKILKDHSNSWCSTIARPNKVLKLFQQTSVNTQSTHRYFSYKIPRNYWDTGESTLWLTTKYVLGHWKSKGEICPGNSWYSETLLNNKYYCKIMFSAIIFTSTYEFMSLLQQQIKESTKSFENYQTKHKIVTHSWHNHFQGCSTNVIQFTHTLEQVLAINVLVL